MENNLKDIIYPTIKRQFDKLTPHVSYEDGDMTVEFFYGDSVDDYLVYEESDNTLFISISYFMLNYFGYTEDDESFNEVLIPIFTELINESFTSPVINEKRRFQIYYLD